MQSYDIRVISVSYRREDDSDTVTVDIFGKTKDGTVVLARRPHRPWFHVIEPTKECVDFLKSSPETYELKECVLWHNRLKRKAVHVVAKHPWKVGGDEGMRNELERRFNATVASCDIPFQLRFVYDYDIPSCVRVTGEPVSNPKIKEKYSAKIIIDATDFQELPPFDVPIKVLCFDIENSIKHKTIFCIGCALRDGDKPIVTEIFSGSEADMIKEWVEYIKKVDPDVLCGYNSDGYDLPFIMNRADLLGLKPWETSFGRDGSRAFQPGETNNWKCHGRVIADVWWAVKREVKPKREKLNFVAEKLLGEKKDDVDSSKMDEEWAKDKDRVMEYCMKDASLTLRVFEHEKVRTVQKALDLANVARLPFCEAYDARTSLLIDSFLIRECDRRNIAVPPTRRHSGEEEEKIEGGYVKLPTAGLYNMVFAIDVGCFSTDTQLLTKSGWKPVPEIKIDDTVATTNFRTGRIEFQRVEKTYCYEYSGVMKHINGVGIDQLVTPNHRVYFYERNRTAMNKHGGLHWKSKISVQEAQNIPDFVSIPHFGVWDNPGLEKIRIGKWIFNTDDFVRWLGWFIAEGNFGKNKVVVSQSNIKKIPLVRDAFKKLSIPFSETTFRRDYANFYGTIYKLKYNIHHTFSIFNAEFLSVFSTFMGGVSKSGDRRIPRYLLDNLSSKQCRILLETLTLGDGNKTDTMWRYSTISPGLADDVQELALKAGYSAIASKRTANLKNRKPFAVYYVGISRHRRNVLRYCRGHFKNKKYHGNVYCVTVPNHTVICRRDGKVSVSGNSMYPSQIKKNNICFTTRDQEGTIISPHDSNVRYLTADIKEGLLPYMMRKLGDDRKVAKKKKAEAKAAGRKGDAGYYDGLQAAIKVVMNATYGVFASSFYRFTDRDIGATITAFAREAIKDAAEKLEAEGIKVLYSDTDSCFIKSPHESLIETVRLGNDIAERYSEGGVNFEFEKVMDPWFTHGMKKRYFGHLLWPAVVPLVETANDEVRLWVPKKEAAVTEMEKIPGAKWMSKENYWSFPPDQLEAVKDVVHKFFSGEHDDDMLVRGYETRRTDSFDLQSEAMTTMFQKILDRDIPGAIEFAVDVVQKTVRGEIPYPKLVISRSVKEDGEYKQNPDRMVNVLVSRKLVEMGQEFTPGMKVSWIVTNSRKTPQEAEPYIDGRLFDHEPDWAYYAERLAKSLARITELWDWDAKALLSKSRQAQLYNDGVTKATAKPKKRRGKKKFPPSTGSISSSLGSFGVDIPKRAPPAALTQPLGEKVIYRADPPDWPSRWETTPGCCMICGRPVAGPPFVRVYKPSSETAFLPAHVGCFEKKFPDVDIEDVDKPPATTDKL